MRKLIALAALAVAALVAVPTAVQAQPQAKQTTYAFLRCESPGGRPSFCPADTRRGVRLVNDLSGRCRLGRTWGYRRDGIWISGGCAAEFEIGRYGDDYGWGWGHVSDRYIVCASDGYRREFCPARTGMGVRLVNQISEAPCIRGRTWWRDANGIVVSEGCAGEFEISYREEPYVSPPSHGGGGFVRPDRLVCESRDYRRRYCPADIGYGAAVLVRQTSHEPCVFGRNWSYDRRGIWVQDGCAGEFELGYQTEAWRPGSGMQWVRCESRDYRRTHCRADAFRGVRLARQISRAPCIEGQNWGFDRNRIWVDQGCAADFEVGVTRPY